MWRDHRTAIQIAAAFGEHDLIQMLLELGADPSSCSSKGYTTLHWLVHPEEPIDKYESKIIIYDKKLEKRKMRQPRYQKFRITASVQSLAQSLSACASSIDVTCSNGKTPLMLAVMVSPTATKALLEAGADTNKRDDRGRTALVYRTKEDRCVKSPIIMCLGACMACFLSAYYFSLSLDSLEIHDI
ncbi:ankyrin repeat-containing protein [Colletotrichum graminicola]|nr:ankyrin repeat-containing protein [Colletotrichum graminicola]